MAKPMPILPLFSAPVEAIELVIPTTWPLESNNGPPELPGLMAASIWMALVYTGEPPWSWPRPGCWEPSPSSLFSWRVTTGRSKAETIPVVTVEDRPSGLPIAMTPCPVASLEESPIRATVRSLGACSIWTTAKSVALSVPVREAG